MAEDVQADEQAEVQAEPKVGRGAGRRFVAGQSGNPSGKAKVAEPDPQGGQVNAARLRKVLSQSKGSDTGPTEKLLRTWLEKDPKGYLDSIDKKVKSEGEEAEVRAELAAVKEANAALRAENAALKAQGPAVEETDEGTDRALKLIERLLKEAAEEPAAGGDVHRQHPFPRMPGR